MNNIISHGGVRCPLLFTKHSNENLAEEQIRAGINLHGHIEKLLGLRVQARATCMCIAAVVQEFVRDWSNSHTYREVCDGSNIKFRRCLSDLYSIQLTSR